MAAADFVGALGKTLLTGNNAQGLSAPVFSYPGAASTTAPATSILKPAPAAGTAVANSDPNAAAYAAMAAETRKQNALLQQQLNAAPRLVKYDTAGAAASALSEATAAQTPLYTQKLNDYLAKVNIARAAENRHAQETIQDAQDQLAANLAGSDTSRTRTTQDVNTKIDATNAAQGDYLDASGTAFDAARRGLQGDVANAGLAESGLGAQKLDEQQAAQGADSKTQNRQFEATKTAANLFKTRTFEDLAKSDELNKTLTDKAVGRTKLNLEDYLNTSNIDEQQTRSDLEQQRQGAILTDSITRQQNKASAFIAQLIQSGARPQDIALAKQIYG